MHRSSIYNKHVVFFMTLCDTLVIFSMWFGSMQRHSPDVAALSWEALARKTERVRDQIGSKNMWYSPFILHIISSHFFGSWKSGSVSSAVTFLHFKWPFFGQWIHQSDCCFSFTQKTSKKKFVSHNLMPRIYISFNFQPFFRCDWMSELPAPN